MPPFCYLCGTDRATLRFPARRGDEGDDAAAYNCTNFGHRSHEAIWKCAECGLLTQWPRPVEEELVEAYALVEDPLYVAERENRYLTFGRVIGRLGSANGRRLLDVGAYCGYFLDVARSAGFDAEGLELSKWAAEQAREIGLTVHVETLAQRAESDDRYDAITLWDVVEHLADPRTELEHIRTLLQPDGRLYLSTIDAGSLVARRLGSRWPWLMDMHLYYFDRRTIALLLERSGFTVQEIRHYTHVVSGRYLLQKLGASFPALRPVTSAIEALVPSRVRVPVNLGDNMFVVAKPR